MTEPFKFNRSGDLKVDPRRAQIVCHRDGQTLLGDVLSQYRDEDQTIRLRVRYFNGEPWPFDPPAGVVLVLTRD